MSDHSHEGLLEGGGMGHETEIDMDMVDESVRFAAIAHGRQKMPGDPPVPYITHVSLVMLEVFNVLRMSGDIGNPTLALTCAALHDVMEDCSVSFTEIEERFGLAVAEGVAALSKNDDLPMAEAMADSIARIRMQPVEIAIVKLCDRIVNMASPPKGWSMEKRQGYAVEAKMILSELGYANRFAAERLLGRISAYSRRNASTSSPTSGNG